MNLLKQDLQSAETKAYALTEEVDHLENLRNSDVELRQQLTDKTVALDQFVQDRSILIQNEESITVMRDENGKLRTKLADLNNHIERLEAEVTMYSNRRISDERISMGYAEQKIDQLERELHKQRGVLADYRETVTSDLHEFVGHLSQRFALDHHGHSDFRKIGNPITLINTLTKDLEQFNKKCGQTKGVARPEESDEVRRLRANCEYLQKQLEKHGKV